MDNEKTVYIICPQCGYVCRNDSPSRFPICECCKYEDPIIMSQADYKMFEDELTGKDPDAKCYESLREKYVYNNEHFSKKAYNDMLAYADEKFKKEYAEWVRSNNPGKIECPVCHTISGKKISVGAKAVSVGLYGIFSQKVKKTWHCEICGYEW